MQQYGAMRRKIVSVAAWLVATAASILLATAAVGNVGGWSGDRPIPLQASVSSLVTPTPTPTTPTPTTTQVPPSTTAVPSTTVATTAAPTTIATGSVAATTKPPESPTTTKAPPPSTTSTSTTTTTTTAPPGGDEYFESRQLIGGWVQLRINRDNVYLDAAVPEPGFTVDVEHNGPETVEVEFKSESHDSKLHAKVHDGELDIKVEEEAEDD